MTLPFILPHLALRPYVLGYWKAEFSLPDGVRYTQRTIPTGQMFFLFFQGESFTGRPSDGSVYALANNGFIGGQLSHYREITMQGNVEGFWVQFRPSGFYSLFGIPAGEFTDLGVDFASALGTKGKSFSQRILEANSWQEQLALTEQLLLKQLSRLSPSGPLVEEALWEIHATQGKQQVEALSASLRTSRRTLTRQFNEKVGLSAKRYARIVRFNALLRAITATPSPLQWLDLVEEYGYFDQAHLINEFSDFAGRTPRELFRNQNEFDAFQLTYFRGN